MSDDLLHGSRIPMYDGTHGGIVAGRAGETIFTYITINGNTIYTIDIDLASEDLVNIPTINANHSDIFTAFNGSRYDAVTQSVVDDYEYLHLIVFNDGFLPNVDDLPDVLWFNEPSGLDIQIDSFVRLINGRKYFDAFARDPNNFSHKLYIRVEVRSKNETVLSNNALVIGDTTFKIYPNPVNNNLHIECTEGIKSVLLVNLLGKEVFKKEFQNITNNRTVNTSSLPIGTYIVKMISEHKTQIKKIIIAR